MVSAKTVALAQEYMSRGTGPEVAGWLVHDYRGSNPIFRRVVGELDGFITRPCFLFMPAAGRSRLLVHHVDAGKFRGMDLDPIVYSSRGSMLEGMESLVPAGATVAMEYSPGGALPRVSKVDAGTIDMLRGLGLEVVSSADLVQYATLRWDDAALASHLRAADALTRIVQDAFGFVGARLAGGPTEYDVAEFIRERFRDEGIHAPDGPIVAVNGHASDPHYEPGPQGSSVIRRGDWLLIDLWARELAEEAMYADITWVAYVGGRVPEEHQKVWEIVSTARDAALKYLEGSSRQGITLQGAQVDRIAREYIGRQGYGEQFTHRLGHSINTEVHGDAVNLDSFETEDTRSIVSGICFSIEPGIYLPEFGVRSEIDVYMSEDGPYATTEVQRDVVLINAS